MTSFENRYMNDKHTQTIKMYICASNGIIQFQTFQILVRQVNETSRDWLNLTFLMKRKS